MRATEESVFDRQLLLDELNSGWVQVWYAFPIQIRPEWLLGRTNVLSADEQDRAKRFHFDRDRLHYVAAHLLLRDSLARYVDSNPQALQFQKSEFGKPFLSKPEVKGPLEFNLTHTQGLVACAVSRTRVGIDAEFVDRIFDDTFSKWVMAEHERQDLQQYADQSRTIRLLECWTLKEAYLKAKGVGLSQSLDSFSFVRKNDGYQLQLNESHLDSSLKWQFHLESMLSPKHIMSIAQERTESMASAKLEIRFHNCTKVLGCPLA